MNKYESQNAKMEAQTRADVEEFLQDAENNNKPSFFAALANSTAMRAALVAIPIFTSACQFANNADVTPPPVTYASQQVADGTVYSRDTYSRDEAKPGIFNANKLFVRQSLKISPTGTLLEYAENGVIKHYRLGADTGKETVMENTDLPPGFAAKLFHGGTGEVLKKGENGKFSYEKIWDGPPDTMGSKSTTIENPTAYLATVETHVGEVPTRNGVFFGEKETTRSDELSPAEKLAYYTANPHFKESKDFVKDVILPVIRAQYKIDDYPFSYRAPEPLDPYLHKMKSQFISKYGSEEKAVEMLHRMRVEKQMTDGKYHVIDADFHDTPRSQERWGGYYDSGYNALRQDLYQHMNVMKAFEKYEAQMKEHLENKPVEAKKTIEKFKRDYGSLEKARETEFKRLFEKDALRLAKEFKASAEKKASAPENEQQPNLKDKLSSPSAIISSIMKPS